MKIKVQDNKLNLPLKYDIIAIVLFKLILISVIYYLWFDNPVETSESSIEQHLFR